MRSLYALIRSFIRRIPGVAPLRPPRLKWVPFDPEKQALSCKDRKSVQGDLHLYPEEES